MKIKKVKKSKKLRGTTTHGWGARKKHKGRGHRGGTGMAGTGKGADHKKSLVIKKYGNKYFGKKGETSKKTGKKRVKSINLRDIDRNFESYKKNEKNGWLDLSDFKILDGKLSKKIKVRALDVSKGARERIEKAGGEIKVLRKRDEKENIDNTSLESEGENQTGEGNPKDLEVTKKIIETEN